MKAEKREQYEQRLQELRDRLTTEVEHLAQSLVEGISPPGELSSTPLHNADRDSSGLTRDLAVEQNETALLADVVAALERLDAGTFGKCVACGRPISPPRLDAMPFAACCLECQTERESAEEVGPQP